MIVTRSRLSRTQPRKDDQGRNRHANLRDPIALKRLFRVTERGPTVTAVLVRTNGAEKMKVQIRTAETGFHCRPAHD